MDREGADQRDGNGDNRNDRRPPRLQEDHDDDHDQDHRFEKGALDRGHRGLHELRRIVRDLIGDPLRHRWLQFLDRLQDLGGRRQGVRPRLLHDRQTNAAISAEVAAHAVVLRAEFDTRDVANAGHAAVGVGADNDIPELFGIGQTALNLHGQLIGCARVGRSLAKRATGGLDVLGAKRSDDFTRGQVARRGLAGVDPDPHRIEAAAEHLDTADAVDPQHAVAQGRVGVVADVVEVGVRIL